MIVTPCSRTVSFLNAGCASGIVEVHGWSRNYRVGNCWWLPGRGLFWVDKVAGVQPEVAFDRKVLVEEPRSDLTRVLRL